MVSQQLTTPPSSNERSSDKTLTPKSNKKKFFSQLLHRKTHNEQRPKLGLKTLSSSGDSSSSTRVSSGSFSHKLKKQLSLTNNSSDGNRPNSMGSSDQEKSNFIDDGVSVYNYAEDDKDEFDTSHLSDASSSSLSLSPVQSSSSLSNVDGFGIPYTSNSNLDEIINDNMISTDDNPWEGLTMEALVTPLYVKAHKRNKHSPRALNNLFLAQELNVDSCTSKEINDNESMSSESIKLGFSTSEEEHDEVIKEHEKSTNEFHNAKSQGYSKKPAQGRQMKNNISEIFVMEFSRDGKYLAVAGRDSVIKVWKVISSPLGRLEERHSENGELEKRPKSRNKVYNAAPVFHLKPVKVFKGHSHSILSLDWSKNNFLISGSMDRTVKLWHVDRSDCLGTFQNEDFVTTVKFHPNDDRFFLSGSLDNQVRLWSILEKSIAYSKDLGDDILITASCFTPDGQHCIVGGFNGTIFALEIKGLHIINRFEIKDKSFVHSFNNTSGNKITGIKIFESTEYAEFGDIDNDPLARWNFLITTNDSKVRLVNSGLKKLVTRFRGLSNNSSSIVASMTDDFHYIVAGSEDHWCYVWENNNSIINNKLKLALKDLVLEGKSHINDLQNKHKTYARLVHNNRLMKKLNIQKFLDEDKPHEYVANENNSYAAFHAHHSKVNAAIFAPEPTKKLLELSDDIIFDLFKRGKKCNFCENKVNESSKNDLFDENMHENELIGGHILVTTDQFGLIRVFRQDSAYEVRKKLIVICRQNKSDNLRSRCKSDSRIASNSHLIRTCDPKIANKNNKNNLKLDLSTNRNQCGRKLLIRNRSASPSPSHESYFALKNKLQNKLKGNCSTSSNNTYPNTDSKSSSKSNLPKYISSSSLINGGLYHLNSSSSGIMRQTDVTLEMKDDEDVESLNASENSHIPASGNASMKNPGSAYAITTTPTNDNRSATTLTPQQPPGEEFPPISNEKKQLPLLINTRSLLDKDESASKSEVIDFHTPINDSRNMDQLFESLNHLSHNSLNDEFGDEKRGRMKVIR